MYVIEGKHVSIGKSFEELMEDVKLYNMMCAKADDCITLTEARQKADELVKTLEEDMAGGDPVVLITKEIPVEGTVVIPPTQGYHKSLPK